MVNALDILDKFLKPPRRVQVVVTGRGPLKAQFD
jgi:hypothetical protein